VARITVLERDADPIPRFRWAGVGALAPERGRTCTPACGKSSRRSHAAPSDRL